MQVKAIVILDELKGDLTNGKFKGYSEWKYNNGRIIKYEEAAGHSDVRK